MTFRGFYYRIISFSLISILTVVSFNIFMNEFGLFGDVKGKSIDIYFNERRSKYLLSYNYIPSNFEAILIGPSVSNNMNTKTISEYKIYNASINGSNISELKYIVSNVIKNGKLKFIIICLYPYLTRDHGRKSSSINEREYWGSLGSIDSIKLYLYKFLIKYNLKSDYFNDYGYNNFNIKMQGIDSKKVILEKASSKNKIKEITIDEIAYEELKYVLDLAIKNNVRIFGYYYPIPYDYFVLSEKNYRWYQEKIDKLFDEDAIILDFNSDKYLKFVKDYSNYCDVDHLSYKGSDFILKQIKIMLDQNI